MRLQVLQHVPFEGLGSIAPWLEARGDQIQWTRLFAGDPLPAVDASDALVILGGPMSVNDEDEHPWLRPEKQLVRESIACHKPTLGVCLGAQLIASALGARVYPASEREIGWWPLRGAAHDTPAFVFPTECTAFHWHGETFDLPDNAVRLAGTESTENQAFQVGRHVVALQFHLESTPESVEAMLTHCQEDLAPGPFVQEGSQQRRDTQRYSASTNRLMDEVLAYVFTPHRRTVRNSSEGGMP